MADPSTQPAWEDARHNLLAIASAAIKSVDPYRAVKANLDLRMDKILVGSRQVPLYPDSRIYLVGMGKAGVPMSTAAAEILGARLARGIVSVPEMPATSPANVEFIVGGHPIPTEGSLRAGERVAALLEEVHTHDVVMVMISGGGSALLELPKMGIELEDLARINELLIRSGVPIEEINTVRIQLSQIKGGGLLRFAAPASCIGFILSDVIGDDLAMVASGPTVPSTNSEVDALEILKRYDLQAEVPAPLLEVLNFREPEQDLANSTNVLIGNNQTAVTAAENRAREIGYSPLKVSLKLRGEARIAGERIGVLANVIGSSLKSDDRPACVILGGETVVTVTGVGSGGRNQELALAAGMQFDPEKRIALFALATDGVDGPTPAAGAIVSSSSMQEALAKGMNPSTYLEQNNSYEFFHEIDACVVTGPTQTNVNDLVLCIVHPGPSSGAEQQMK